MTSLVRVMASAKICSELFIRHRIIMAVNHNSFDYSVHAWNLHNTDTIGPLIGTRAIKVSLLAIDQRMHEVSMVNPLRPAVTVRITEVPN